MNLTGAFGVFSNTVLPVRDPMRWCGVRSSGLSTSSGLSQKAIVLGSGGQMGLVLENAVACDPVPSVGALGYFAWEPAAAFAPVKPWMTRWGGGVTTLFGDLEPVWRDAPKKPFGSGK